MTKAIAAVALLLAVAALALAAVAFHEARDALKVPTQAEITAAAVHEFQGAGNRMTPDEVLRLLGNPADVFRDNPRALCWHYSTPYEIRMCWGPKRQSAWIATNIPRDKSPLNLSHG